MGLGFRLHGVGLWVPAFVIRLQGLGVRLQGHPVTTGPRFCVLHLSHVQSWQENILLVRLQEDS